MSNTETKPLCEESTASSQAQKQVDCSNEVSSGTELRLKVSSSLQNRLVAKASLEGVSIEELALELICEGLVLRAWEVMERKSQMKGRHSTFALKQNSQKNYPKTGRFNQKNSGNAGNNRGSNFQNIMEDNASFLEYVRNQEKKKGR